MGLVEPAVLVVGPVHAEQDGFLYMTGGAQFERADRRHISGWLREGVRREFVLPQEKPKQRAFEHLRRNVAAVVAVGQRGQMHVAVDEGLVSHGQLSD